MNRVSNRLWRSVDVTKGRSRIGSYILTNECSLNVKECSVSNLMGDTLGLVNAVLLINRGRSGVGKRVGGVGIKPASSYCYTFTFLA